MVKLTFLGHACFLIDDGTYKLIVDPFLDGNPSAAVRPEDVKAEKDREEQHEEQTEDKE